MTLKIRFFAILFVNALCQPSVPGTGGLHRSDPVNPDVGPPHVAPLPKAHWLFFLLSFEVGSKPLADKNHSFLSGCGFPNVWLEYFTWHSPPFSPRSRACSWCSRIHNTTCLR